MKIYRGDTFPFDFSATLEDGSSYTFKKGETLKVGIKNRIGNIDYLLYQKKEIEKDTQIVSFEFTHEEMKKICPGIKILELELTNLEGKVSTIYQKEIEIVGDVINE